MPTELSHLIQYRCVRADHQRLNDAERVFVHAGEWAYCPAGKQAVDHYFAVTGGLDRQRLEAGVRPQGSGKSG